MQRHRQTCSSNQQHRARIGLKSRENGVKNTVCAIEGLKRGNWHCKGGMCRRKTMTNEQVYGLGCLVSQEKSCPAAGSGGHRAAHSNASVTH